MKFLFLLLVVSAPSVGFSQIFIGNSGEGVMVHGGLYLRDLFEASLEKDPYVGSVILSSIKERSWMLARVEALGVDKDLLQRKLSDAEILKKGLGIYLLELISTYSWQFVPDLALLPDDAPIIPNFPRRVPLARRFKTSVLVHKKNFEMLPASHKVALLIHEAVSSLVKLKGTDCLVSVCSQSAYEARQITAYIFSQNFCPIGLLGRCNDDLFDASLDIHPDAAPRGHGLKMGISSVDGLAIRIERGLSHPKDFVNQSVSICAELETRRKQNPFVGPFLLELYRPGYRLDFYSYRAHNFTYEENYQTGVKVAAEAPHCVQTLFLQNQEKCENSLQELAEFWFVEENKKPNDHSCLP